MACKGKPSRQKNRKKKVASSTNKNTLTGKSCRVCSTLLVVELNWAPSRVARRDYICGSCKGNQASSPTMRTGRSCRVCSTLLVVEHNWAPSRVARRDYICGSCHTSKRTGSTKVSTPPNCPKCKARMVMRYSDRFSREFWGCPKFPTCRGTRDA